MPPPPLPKPKQSVPAIPRAVVWAIVVRVLMLVIVVVSVSLAWWSINRLTQLEATLRARDSERSALVTEVQQLEMKWDAAAAERLDAQVKQAQELLFTGAEEMERWQKELRRQGLALAIGANVQMSNAFPHPKTEHQLSLVPATLDLAPAPAVRSTNAPYNRLLAFTGTLDRTNRRIDVVELTVTGNSNSVQHARAVVQLWAAGPDAGKPLQR